MILASAVQQLNNFLGTCVFIYFNLFCVAVLLMLIKLFIDAFDAKVSLGLNIEGKQCSQEILR